MKGESLWEFGIFLGTTTTSNEFLMGTASGVYTARAVRRTEPQKRVNKELLNTFVGLPWDTKTRLGRPKRPISQGGAEARSVPEGEREDRPEDKKDKEDPEDDEEESKKRRLPGTPGQVPATPVLKVRRAGDREESPARPASSGLKRPAPESAEMAEEPREAAWPRQPVRRPRKGRIQARQRSHPRRRGKSHL